MEWQNIAPLLNVVHASQGVPEAAELRTAALAELVKLNKVAADQNAKARAEAKVVEDKVKADAAAKATTKPVPLYEEEPATKESASIDYRRPL